MARVGVVPEMPDAPPEMTAAALSAFCARLYPRWNADEVQSRLARFDVPPNVRFDRLSKGQRGAVMLALALGHGPDLLILDDPTLGLDVIARRGFYDELLGDLADRGITVFITTHDLAGVEGIADRVAILRGGRLVIDEPMEGLKARFRRLRLPSAPATPPPFRAVANGRSTWEEERIVSDFDQERFEAWRATQPGDVVADSVSLEDIFVAVVGGEKGGRQ
jgi:ABC-2 type transport system ATP-binding protein